MNSFNPTGKRIDRENALLLVQTALAVKSLRFAQQAALKWLAMYPGDLEVKRLYGESLLTEGRADQASAILEEVCQRDPEDVAALRAWLSAARIKGAEDFLALRALVPALTAQTRLKSGLPEWTRSLMLARRALRQNKLDAAEEHLRPVLMEELPTALAAVTHLRILLAKQSPKDHPSDALRNLAAHYRQQWPDCVACKLVYAHTLMDCGRDEQAVAILHQAVTQDVTGQVARRLWGVNHPYRRLWPDFEKLAMERLPVWDIPVPAEVASALGWNRLPERVLGEAWGRGSISRSGHPAGVRKAKDHLDGQRAESSATSGLAMEAGSLDEELRQVQEELARVAARLKSPNLARMDGRFPVYVVLSTRRGLEDKYGKLAAKELLTMMRRLTEVVGGRMDWDGLLILADDSETVTEFGLQPVPASDPWKIKLLLADLDQALGKQGRMIGALLIVGGPQVVPFHHLPNPIDDEDEDVPSDNPYATRDENYFIPEWPVGRLPDGEEKDPTLLIQSLREMIRDHQQRSKPLPWYRQLWLKLLHMLYAIRFRPDLGFGYTAAIWRKVSMKVFRQIGDPRGLWVSPPRTAEDTSRLPLPTFRLGYFNLHGLVDAVEWYGQKDPLDNGSSPMYPVALRPGDLPNGGGAPEVVFSEACYGAHVYGRNVEQALCLKFLACGTRAVVGSTVAAYGGLTAPLFAADLLGQAFWQLLKQGLTVGEALQRAKWYLVRRLIHKQGYLDSEDQKSLISFVLYGDPLYQPQMNGRGAKSRIFRRPEPVQVKTVCDRKSGDPAEDVSPEVLAQVKSVVANYLPGMQGAELSVSEQHGECRGQGHLCPTAQLGAKDQPVHPHHKVVMLSKKVSYAKHIHPHFARMTMDEHGKLIRLSVSR